MKELSKVILKTKKDRSLRRFHPWVFSGAIKKMEGDPTDGDMVEVFSNKDGYLGTGHYQSSGSIPIRVFSFEKVTDIEGLWEKKLKDAVELRECCSFFKDPQTNAFRLIFAEGDGIPGLIADLYDKTLILQAYTPGIHRMRKPLATSLKGLLKDRVENILYRPAESLRSHLDEKVDQVLEGEFPEEPIEILENGYRFLVDVKQGQKTGFFLDQRDNRALLGKYASGRKILNTFGYTGGFSVYGLDGGATEVHTLDSSSYALELAEKNVGLNFPNGPSHKSIDADAMDFLKEPSEDYDLIILDPPAFAKRRSSRHKAIQGYKRLNSWAIEHLPPGGLLFTFSCSQVVDEQIFQDTIISAAINSGRKVQVLHKTTHAPDHPISLYHPEGQYLKGLVLKID